MNRETYLFSERIKFLLRVLYGNDVKYMARDCNLPLRTLQSYLYEGRSPSIESLWKIKEATGETFDWLLGAVDI